MKQFTGLKILMISSSFLAFNFCYARTSALVIDGVKLQGYELKNKRNNPDGSTCIDAIGNKFPLTVCFFKTTFTEASKENGFFEYKKLPKDARDMVGDLQADSLVYGSGNWIYPTSKLNIGKFTVYEADDVLCHDSESHVRNRGDTCYFSALRNAKPIDMKTSIFLSSKIGNKASKQREIMWIHEFIRSIVPAL